MFLPMEEASCSISSATSTRCRSAGGAATLLLGGAAYEMQPRFSPDGRRIAFASDRDGITNVWTMDLNGKRPPAGQQGTRARSVQPCVDA